MFNIFKKSKKEEEVVATHSTKLDISAKFKLTLPEFVVACLGAAGDHSLDTLMCEFKTGWISVSRGDLLGGLSHRGHDESDLLLLQVHKELLQHLKYSKISKEAAQVLMSTVKLDYESLSRVFEVAEFMVVFDGGVEVRGSNFREILGKAEVLFKDATPPSLDALRELLQLHGGR